MSDPEIEKYKKHDIVYFHKWGATIFTVIGDTAQYEGLSNVLIDPDYTLVRGHPPHHWCINNATLALLPSDIIKQRDEYHSAVAHQNPKVIRVENVVEKVVEKIKEVPKEISTTKIVFREFFPKWAYFTHIFLVIIIIFLLMRHI